MADSRIQKFEGRLAAPRRRLNLVDEAVAGPPASEAAGSEAAAAPEPAQPETVGPTSTTVPEPAAAEPATEVDTEVVDTEDQAEIEASPAVRGKTSSGTSVKRRTPGPTPKKPNATADAGARVTLKVDEDLRNALDRAARSRACSLADVVFDAIEQAASADRLGDIVLEHAPDAPTAPARADALFARTVSRRAKPKVTVELRMIDSDRKILDHMVKQYKADSRTHLIIAALRAHLDLAA